MDEYDAVSDLYKLKIEMDRPVEGFTLWGHFDPGDGLGWSCHELDWAQPICWYLTENRGRPLSYMIRDVLSMGTGAGDYCSFSKLLSDLGRLVELGVVEIRSDKIILRRTRASPLERLARCAD